jgi:hypothetical protein
MEIAVNSNWKKIVWQQFGASIDMLENALRACPEALWRDCSDQPEFWYLVFHTLFWLDVYLSDSVEEFAAALSAPFTLCEMDPAGIMPERIYTKEELQTYLAHGREKCRRVLNDLTDEKAFQSRRFGSIEGSRLELLLYNMRHVQHHAAQLNLILRQAIDSAPGWVAKAGSRLSRGNSDEYT